MKKLSTIIVTLTIGFYLIIPAISYAQQLIDDDQSNQDNSENINSKTEISDPKDDANDDDDNIVKQSEEKLDPQLASCLKEKLGEEAFNSFKTGERTPDDEDKSQSESCFEKHGPGWLKQINNLQPKDRQVPDFSPSTAACLEKTVGADYKQQMIQVRSHEAIEAFHQKTKNCFGIPPQKGDGNVNPEIAKQLKECIASAVGQDQAEKIFAGNKPEPGSEQFTKIESAGCFKKFNIGPPPGQGPREKLSPEKESCIKSVIGDIMGEPSEAQRQEIGKKCFADQKPGGPNNQMPEELEKCLMSKVGEKFKQGPEAMTEEDKQKAGECFQNSNFRPLGEEHREGQGPQGGPQMDEKTKSCIERVTGQSADRPIQFSDDQRQKVGNECFSLPAGQYGDPNQPNDQKFPGPPSNEDQSQYRGRQPNNECVRNILGDQRTPATPEQQEKLNRECFNNNQQYSGQSGSPEQNNQNPPPNQYQPPSTEFQSNQTYTPPPSGTTNTQNRSTEQYQSPPANYQPSQNYSPPMETQNQPAEPSAETRFSFKRITRSIRRLLAR